jgi:coenzyme F420-0:L-glutamate ligase / coenzyme F420-1:gamma-L-glutamate ligase
LTAGRSLLLTALSDFPLIRPGDDLAGLILQTLDRNRLLLESGDVLVLAQKIVSKSENRLVDLTTITPSRRAIDLSILCEKDPRFVEVVLRESREVLRVRPGLLVVEHRLGFVCANAGVDRSNVGRAGGKAEWVLLLPEDPDASCRTLRERIRQATGAVIGVIINDSHGRAWRNGTVGVAIGVGGFPALEDLRGRKDLFDYTLQITQVAAADELAAAASLLMGQADEALPIIHARGFPYPMRESSLAELVRPKEIDAFR